jgi:hypothetical protein
MTQVIVNIVSGFIPPFSGVACDVYGNNCSYIGSGTTFPTTFTLTSQFDSAPAFQLTLTDSSGCSVSEILYCSDNVQKQFQNMEYFVFMDGELYQFQ